MRFRFAAATGLLVITSSVASAQASLDPQCASKDIRVQDACQQTVDLFQYMAPQLGIAVTGGNATLAQGGALGGLPHFTVGVRANLLAGHVPDLQTPDPSGPQQRANYRVSSQFLGLPAVDASIGLFGGLPLALTNVGGVDLLLSASYVPKVEADQVSVEPDTPLKIGYGVRIGLLQESLVVPGVSVTFLKRDLPKTSILGGIGSDSLKVTDLDLKTTAWRVVASKSLILFGIAAGVGQDTYDASTIIEAVVSRTLPLPFTVTTGPLSMKQKVTRTNYFADLSLNLFLAKLVGEVGMVSGGDIATYNTFGTAADASRLYGSVGLRIGF